MNTKNKIITETNIEEEQTMATPMKAKHTSQNIIDDILNRKTQKFVLNKPYYLEEKNIKSKEMSLCSSTDHESVKQERKNVEPLKAKDVLDVKVKNKMLEN